MMKIGDRFKDKTTGKIYIIRSETDNGTLFLEGKNGWGRRLIGKESLKRTCEKLEDIKSWSKHIFCEVRMTDSWCTVYLLTVPATINLSKNQGGVRNVSAFLYIFTGIHYYLPLGEYRCNPQPTSLTDFMSAQISSAQSKAVGPNKKGDSDGYNICYLSSVFGQSEMQRYDSLILLFKLQLALVISWLPPGHFWTLRVRHHVPHGPLVLAPLSRNWAFPTSANDPYWRWRHKNSRTGA